MHKRLQAVAEELHISYNELVVHALQEFLLRRENGELTARLNEAYADYPDEEERQFLAASRHHMRRIFECRDEE